MKTLEEVFETYEAVIGLEVHTELTTLNTKMFCGCKLSHDEEPNAHVCPVCLGLPGALPVPNKAAIESIVLAGLATHCDIEKESMFYRKNYFYPDMSKNFQTTQGPVAFCMRGYLDLDVDDKGSKERIDKDGAYSARIGITRIHMEEDAGKLIHVGGVDGRISGASHSLIDYNRCGTPLIELVTEPELKTPEEARLFMQKLRTIFLTLGISDCSMESGSMRCDGNVSLRKRGESTLGTKTELKNMNSFKNLHDGLAYEICRQAEVLDEGGVILQETRHWEPSNKRTVVMRTKETADDYRLFPEPDMAPFKLTDEFIASVQDKLPELPDEKKARYESDFGLGSVEARAIADDGDLAHYFEQAAGEVSVAPTVAKLLLNEVAGLLNSFGEDFSNTRFEATHIGELAQLLNSGDISSKQAKDVLSLMSEEKKSPKEIVELHNMKQVSDSGALQSVVDEVIVSCPDQVQQFKDGNDKVLGYLVGQCMKASKGQGNPKMLNELLRKTLSE